MNFGGKVIIVTGAGSGIGAATAVFLSKLGAKLSLTDRDAQNLEKTRSECDKSAQIFCVIAELTKESEIETIINQTVEQYDQIDVLINNAAILEFGTIENTSLAQYDLVMSTNLRSIYYLTMLAVPYLIKSKGNIVNVSSVNGIRSSTGVIAYNLSKAGIDQFTKCTALELASKGVRVNCVNPGATVTNLQKHGGLSEEQYAAFLEQIKKTYPFGRPGNPVEVATTIAFLASELASNTTGASVPVDGGRHAMCPR